jgi:hypothetical protein
MSDAGATNSRTGFRAHFYLIWGLLAFAVAQPLFDLLLRHPTFLSEHRVGWRQAVALIGGLIVICVAWAAALASLERRSGRLAASATAASAGILFALIALPALRTKLPSTGALGLAAALGVAGSILLWRSTLVRRILSIVPLAGALFCVVFFVRIAVRQSPHAPAARHDARSGGRHSLFLIVMDEVAVAQLLRAADELDAVRFPHLSRFANDAVWFRNAYTANAYTERSVPILVTGRRPKASQRPIAADHSPNLFTLLQDSYEIVARESLTSLCPPHLRSEPAGSTPSLAIFFADCGVLWLHRVVPESWRRRLPSIDHRWADFLDLGPPAEEPAAAFRAWLSQLRASSRPLLGFLHLLYPHGPYVRYSDGRRYAKRPSEPFLDRIDWVDDEWATHQAQYRARLQMQHYDSLLGECFDHLRRLGLYEDAVIALVADHGASFRPGKPFRVTVDDNLMDILPIPMFVKLPNGARSGTIDRRLVSSLDLLPTLLDAAGIEPSWRLDGRSMLDPQTPGRDVAEVLQPAAAPDTTLLVSPAELARHLEALPIVTGVLAQERGRSFGPYVDLVGRSVLELQQGASSEAAVFLHDAAALAQIESDAEWIPGELRGSIETAAVQSRSRDLAIALRDTVVAVTKTVREAEPRRAWEWVALLPAGALRGRDDRLEFFEIAPGPLLHALRFEAGEPSYLDRRLGLGTTAHLAVAGFYRDFPDRGELRRWTDGKGRLSVPIRPSERAARIRIQLAASSPQGCRLQVIVCGQTLLDTRIAAGAWEGEIALPLPLRSRSLEIELRSSGFVPARSIEGSTDTRVLGVLLRGIWLRSEAETSGVPD